MQEEYPNCKNTELVKKASEKWAQIDPTIKQNLQKQYLEQVSVYKQKLMEYENSLTDKQKIGIIQGLLNKGYTMKKNEIKQVFILRRPLFIDIYKNFNKLTYSSIITYSSISLAETDGTWETKTTIISLHIIFAK